MNLSRRKVYAVIAMLATIIAIVGAVALPSLERNYLISEANKNDVPLKLAAESLRAALDRYAPLPALIAERPQLAEALARPSDAELIAQVNEDLRQTAAVVRASDVFLMDISGKTIAAATYLQAQSYLERNFSYQTYFDQALNGNLFSFQVSGTTTGERGYFYAAPVEDGERIVGVLAVKFSIAAFESVWRGADSDFIVSDRNDFILMSSRPDWHFRAMRPLSEQTRQLIAKNLQYPIDRIELLPTTSQTLDESAQLVSIGGDAKQNLVMTSVNLADRGWTMASLSPTRPAIVNLWRTLLIALLTALLALAGLLAYLLEHIRQAEVLVQEQDAKRLLELTVADRTVDLRKALADLRRTQTDLIQAAKLSGLGQMSAALSHEFNQPLTAVKAYAENARDFLSRNRIEEAEDNIVRISKMVDRMALISTHLRNFARRPQQSTGPLLLNSVVHDAIAVSDVRLVSQGGQIEYQPPSEDVWVIGGHVRLQQVIVNLINNGLDSMEGHARQVVEIQLTDTGLKVRDWGAGIDSAAIDQIFDPFFTTKPPGKGLGLGLSISYNIISDFGGTLSAENHPDGGAVFSLELQRASPNKEAAQ